MPIERTLKKIDEDISKGNLGKARDRLHGLLSNDPTNLQFRKSLGDIYWKLQMPEVAGKYWYFEENKTPEMNEAITAFEHNRGNDPMQILFSLHYRTENEENLYVAKILSELHNKAKEKNRFYADYRNIKGYRYKYYNPNKVKPNSNKLVNAGCITILILILLSSIFGVYSFITLYF